MMKMKIRTEKKTDPPTGDRPVDRYKRFRFAFPTATATAQDER